MHETEDRTPAAGAPVERPVRPAAEARWYCLDRDGVAMLCKDEDDARAQVLDNDDCWPRRAPHRAALLGDVAALAAENAAMKREAHTWSKAAETYAASEAKLCKARLAELRHVAEAAQTMRTELAGPARADALYDLREWALNRQRADVLNEGPNV